MIFYNESKREKENEPTRRYTMEQNEPIIKKSTEPRQTAVAATAAVYNNKEGADCKWIGTINLNGRAVALTLRRS